ncbi:MAG: hypothetical protein AABX01_07080 [Candidatus Micrarchaeota archaeon]
MGGLLDKLQNLVPKSIGSAITKASLNSKISEIQAETTKLQEFIDKLEADKKKILLKANEKLCFHGFSDFLQERMIREYSSGFAGFRVARGVYLGGSSGSSESFPTLKKIDRGTLTVTSKRIIFNGTYKNIEIKLDKINTLEPFSNAIEIGQENKQKTMVFTTEYPFSILYAVQASLNPNDISEEASLAIKREINSKIALDLKKMELKSLVLDEDNIRIYATYFSLLFRKLNSIMSIYRALPSSKTVSGIDKLVQSIGNFASVLEDISNATDVIRKREPQGLNGDQKSKYYEKGWEEIGVKEKLVNAIRIYVSAAEESGIAKITYAPKPS